MPLRKLSLRVTVRSDGRVAKRINGRYRTWPSEEAARAELLEMIRREESGVDAPAPAFVEVDPELRILANRFILDRNNRVDDGTLKASSCRDYRRAIDEFFLIVNKHRRSSDLTPEDFKVARDYWERRLGPWKLDSRVQAVRTMFRWAMEVARLTERLPWYGDGFHKTTAAEKRKESRQSRERGGERAFAREELKRILGSDLCTGPLRCFVLLGLNAGMYAAECSQLRKSDLRRIGRDWIIDTDRPKTGVRRKFILWPETAAALQSQMAKRAKVKNEEDKDLIFVTSHGHAWVRENVARKDGLIDKAGEVNSIAMLFGRLMRAEGIKRPGVGFGALRHTHVSAVAIHPDLNAARMVRGHRIVGIEAHYDFPDLSRLRAVTNLARQKLLLPFVTKGRGSRRQKRRPKHRQRRSSKNRGRKPARA